MSAAEEQAVYARLAEIFRDVFGRADITLHPGLTAGDVVGWDSFRHVEIVLALEDHYAIRISTRELERVFTLGDLVALVLGKTASP
ncbi:MAG: acyl carrier protein [Rhodospirillales bacterium]|nr:acyl carrier protein [Rhodospirillales bacterium]